MGGNQHEFVILVLIFLIVSLLSSVDVIRGRSAQINFYKVTRQTALQKEEPKKEAVEALEPPPAQPLFYRQQDSGSKPHGFYGSPPPSPPPPPPTHTHPPHKTHTPPPPPPPPATPSKSNYNPYYYVTQAGRQDLPPSKSNYNPTVIEDTNDDLPNDQEQDEDDEEDELFDTNSNYNPTTTTTKGKLHGPASVTNRPAFTTTTQTRGYQPQQGMSDNRYQAKGMYFYDTDKEEFTSTNHPTNLANQQNMYNRFTTNPTSTIQDVDSLDDQEDIEDFQQQP